MAKRSIVILCVLAALAPLPLAAQQSSMSAAEVAAAMPKDQAQQILKEISVTKFEDAAYWTGNFGIDDGVITLRQLPGSPAAKQPIPDEGTIGIKEQDKNVLGVKVDFFHRGYVGFEVYPTAPLPVEGIAKTVSVWVAGRNFNHTLTLLLQDYYGDRMEVEMGKLNFMGWKKMTVAIPPAIVQSDYHYTYRDGIRVVGFRIDCDPLEARGAYYVYLDDLRAVTDLFNESRRDADDMVDGW
jgi:hypothetical protein